MRRDQPITPFDVEADDMTQQFWGASKAWVSGEQPATVRRSAEQTDGSNRHRRDDTTGSLRTIREGFAALRPQTSANVTGEIRRQRQHGTPRPAPTEPVSGRRQEATLGELAAGRVNAGWLDDELLDDGHFHAAGQGRRVAREPESDYDVPLTPVQPLVDRLGLGAVDPLLLRAGAFVLAMILLVPVMLSLRPDRDDSLPGEVVEAPQQVVAGAAPTAGDVPASASATTATAAPATAAASTGAPASAPFSEPADDVADGEQATEPSAAQAPSSATDSRLIESAGGGADLGAASVDVAAERIVPACPQTYTAAPGDSWYRIAEEAGVTPGELLAENTATTDTVILPGDDICLPEGAAMPTPPATKVVPTTEPAPEPSTSTTPTTTAAPTASTPTTAAPIANLSRSEVQDLIRQTWPEDEVDKALAVARRESNFIATADNGWCCYGVFQIYWTVHAGSLDEFGITERSHLFDARKNIAAAFAIWQRSGWGPWGG